MNASPYYNILLSVDLPGLSDDEIVAFVDAVFATANPAVRADVAAVVRTMCGSAKVIRT